MRRAAALCLLALAAQAPAPASPPVPVPGPGKQADSPHKAALDAAIEALRRAPDEETAAALEAKLRGMWAAAASPAVGLLLSRGNRELSGGDGSEALDSFDAALDLDGTLVEAWRGRAKARLSLGDGAGAIRDIEEALKREPRNFAAWQDLSHIAEARQDWKGALLAWQKMLEVDPRSPGGQERLRDLRRRALGEDA